jgi:Icc-related predicted phosphoesterase
VVLIKLLLAGDWHGDVNHMRGVYAKACRVEADIIVQLGDFGYGWRRSQFKGTGGMVECTFVEQVEKMVKETGIPCYWLDGNHENFDFLYEVELPRRTPEPDGTYQLREGVFYMPRGTMMHWGGYRFLICGGATSLDRAEREPGYSWWWQEALTDEDVEKCKAQGRADFLLTHDFPIECTIRDRHLDPYWGPEAMHATMENRKRVSQVLAACKARAVIHGHLHRAYSEQIMPDGRTAVWVYGLDCNSMRGHYTTMVDSTQLINTELVFGGQTVSNSIREVDNKEAA